MKTKQYLKYGLGLALVACIGLVSFNVIAQAKSDTTTDIVDDINITIDSSTSDSDFEDIKNTLRDYNIKVEFSDIERNDLNEITGIGIKIYTENGQQSMSQMSSNVPIAQISFGRKNGNLYIGQDGQQFDMFTLFNRKSGFPSTFDNDSIFGNHFDHFDFNDFFDDDAFFMFEGDSLNIDQLKEKMKHRFNFGNPQAKHFSFSYDNDKDHNNGRYSFIDNPDLEKVIVIDGEISDFETLDGLAKHDKIDKVDVLKPETAMSIYGKKAKDGAIIVTTK